MSSASPSCTYRISAVLLAAVAAEKSSSSVSIFGAHTLALFFLSLLAFSHFPSQALVFFSDGRTDGFFFFSISLTAVKKQTVEVRSNGFAQSQSLN
jgi:hypothetical protein